MGVFEGRPGLDRTCFFFSRKVSWDYWEMADFPHESPPPNQAPTSSLYRATARLAHALLSRLL